jgi:sulfhydrogenase subunit delta
MSKPTVGIFGLTGCAGDQLVILNCEDELLALVELIDIRSFVMASSAIDEHAQLDVALVEGAVVTDRDEAMIRRIRERSNLLVAIGACAATGGIPGMAPQLDRKALYQDIYGEAAEGFHLKAERGRALSDVVAVDAVIPGCPIEKHEILAAIAALLQGNLPRLKEYPVCTECRIRENRCLLVRDGLPCVGSVTRAGCGARCPSLGVACIGCRGPSVDANYASLEALLLSKGHSRADIRDKLDVFARIPEPVLAAEAPCAD